MTMHPVQALRTPQPASARRALACLLAAAHAEIAEVGIDAPLAEFATPAELQAFRAGLERARNEITAAECVLHDLTFRPVAA